MRLRSQLHGGLEECYERNNQSEWETADTWNSRQVSQEPDGCAKDESCYSPCKYTGVIYLASGARFQSCRDGGAQTFE
ncbi:hypothetical protein GCM10010423_69080 [Streptomyces levis]|uniref:Uncharacterized protein n=1 Tax=Streptomyces levis TaxID=285566 RepID=A0ABN3P2F9_9ACTN